MRILAQGQQARVLRVRGLVPGSFGGFEGTEETAAFNAFSKSVLDTQGAVWCCRWAVEVLAATCSRSVARRAAACSASRVLT